MNSLPKFLIFQMYFAYFDQTFLKPPYQITAQDVEQEMRKFGLVAYDVYLSMELAVASSGKHLIKQPGTLTEDCVRTARVTMDLFTKPSTSQKTQQMMKWSTMEVFKDTSSQNSLNSFCKNLNMAAKQRQFNVSDFEELKKKVVLPKPAQNFALEIPQGVSVLEFYESSQFVPIPEIVKYFAMDNFLELGDKIAKAILTLSQNTAFKSIVDSEFLRVLDDYQKEQSNKTVLTEDDAFDFAFFQKVDEYFTKKSALREEYKKLTRK